VSAPASAAWVVSDGRAGNEVQGIGLAEALGIMPRICRLPERGDLLRLLDRMRPPSTFGLAPPWPDVAIGVGRDAAGPMLSIGRASRGRTLLVQLLRPPRLHGFDLVVVPEHDGLAGPNVLSTRGALNRITPARLEAAGTDWAGRLPSLPRPTVAVLVGGPSKSVKSASDAMASFAAQLAALARAGHGLLVTTSGRTPAADKALLARTLHGLPAWLWTGEGDNPYFAFLAAADAILVTCDSVNMTSEAATTGKPIHVAHWTPLPPKFRRFHEGLQAGGVTRPFTGAIEDWTYAPLAETARVAAHVRGLLATRGQAPAH
jgi:mitochondrial fission protein ELM1